MVPCEAVWLGHTSIRNLKMKTGAKAPCEDALSDWIGLQISHPKFKKLQSGTESGLESYNCDLLKLILQGPSFGSLLNLIPVSKRRTDDRAGSD